MMNVVWFVLCGILCTKMCDIAFDVERSSHTASQDDDIGISLKSPSPTELVEDVAPNDSERQ